MTTGHCSIHHTADGDSCKPLQEGQHADASEQTGQIADGSSPSPCDSMEESMETENLRAEDGSRSSQAVDLKTDVAKR